MVDIIYLSVPKNETLQKINDHVGASEAFYGALATLTNGPLPDGSEGTIIGIDRDQAPVAPGDTRVVPTVGGAPVAPPGFPQPVCQGTVYVTGQLQQVAAFRKA